MANGAAFGGAVRAALVSPGASMICPTHLHAIAASRRAHRSTSWIGARKLADFLTTWPTGSPLRVDVPALHRGSSSSLPGRAKKRLDGGVQRAPPA